MSYAGIARNDSEREQALQLAATHFPLPDDGQDVAILRKTQLLREHPGYTHDSPIIVCSPDGRTVGSAFLINCAVPLKDRVLRGVFVSSVSVTEAARGQGLSRLLMEAAIQSATDRGVDIAMLIARRAVDGYYTRFGFWGLSQYSKVTVKVATLPAGKHLPKSSSLTPVTAVDFELCAALHAENYRNLVGHCQRDSEKWRYILQKLRYIGMRLDLVSIDGKAAGYVLHDEKGNLHEIATLRDESLCTPRTFLEACASDSDDVVLHVHPTHPFLEGLKGADVSLTLRECPYGGHMVRILNPAAFPAGPVGHCKAAPLDFTETAKLMSAPRVTVFDPTLGASLQGSFNIPLLDQI
jgi:predicted N-acetyltransferase YhbS